MNWYLVHLLFAQAADDAVEDIMCETCKVLFEAPTALEAYDKGLAWAERHASGNTFHFVGIEHISDLLHAPGDGVEVDGGFVEISDVWRRREELIPAKADLHAIMAERSPDTSIGELMSEEQKRKAKRIFGG